MLEEKIIEQAKQTKQEIVLVRGLPDAKTQLLLPSFIQQFNHLETADLQALLQESQLVITRSGYTSLMELMQLRIKSVLVQHPGKQNRNTWLMCLTGKDMRYRCHSIVLI